MSAAAVAFEPSPARETLRWGLAGIATAAAQAAVIAAIVTLTPVEEPRASEEALTVDLTPFIMSMPDSVESDTIAEEQPQEVAETLTEETPAEQVEEIPVEEPLEAEPEQPVEAEPEIVQEEVVAPQPEVVLPKPVKAPRKVEKQKPVQKKVTQRAPEKPKQRKQPAPKAENSTKAAASKALAVSPAKWHSQVYAAVARRKPRGKGDSGRVSVRFVVTAAGAVRSAGIANSSGNPALDRAALAMVRGARVPRPPAGLAGSSFPFTIPIVFQ